MVETRTIIRVFLASPGDLEEERRAVRKVVTELNEIWANPLGYHVDLMGWEETIAGYGRPQHIINQEVDRCDLFIGMMWKRWGTAVSVKPGTFVLHSRADDVVPFADSEELIRNSGLAAEALIEVGTDHRLADPEALAVMLSACERATQIE